MPVGSSKLGRGAAWRLALACLAWTRLSCLGWLVLLLICFDFRVLWISLSGLAWPGLPGPGLIWFGGWIQFMGAVPQRLAPVGQTLRQVMRAGSRIIITWPNYQRPGENISHHTA